MQPSGDVYIPQKEFYSMYDGSILQWTDVVDHSATGPQEEERGKWNKNEPEDQNKWEAKGLCD